MPAPARPRRRLTLRFVNRRATVSVSGVKDPDAPRTLLFSSGQFAKVRRKCSLLFTIHTLLTAPKNTHS
jgi:hypothetical protein